MIKSKLATKDEEIELLNTEVNAVHQTIHQLQQRVTELEKQYGESSDHHILAGGATSPSGCLLLGDKNLGSVLGTDLHHNSSVRTIPGADMDLLRRW
ncbi:hypothetical protein Pmani_006305, partial [Petrolisthes manimaculis]